MAEFAAAKALQEDRAFASKDQRRRFDKLNAASNSRADHTGTKAFKARLLRDSQTRELITRLTQLSHKTDSAFMHRLINHFVARHKVSALASERYEVLAPQLSAYLGTLAERCQVTGSRPRRPPALPPARPPARSQPPRNHTRVAGWCAGCGTRAAANQCHGNRLATTMCTACCVMIMLKHYNLMEHLGRPSGESS